MKALCLLAAILLPLTAEAVNVEDDLIVGIQSTKTMAIRPLEPLERDFMSIYNLMYDALMVINDDYLPDYALAESYSQNGKTWTFKLRNDLYFSDGSPVTADDVVATANWILEKARNTQSDDKGYYMNLKYFISSISARDDRTVVVKADRSYYGLLYAMTFPVLPAWALDSDNPPGTGPYTVSSFVPGNTLELVVNPYWWQTQPQVKTILFVMHQSPSAVIEAYEYARVDTAFSRQIASAQYKSGTSSLALDARTNQLECLLMNHSAFPLNSKNVREAIRYLINVDYIAQQIYNGMVERTNTPFVSGTWMYNDDLGAYFKQDAAKAMALLDEDGWSDTNDDGILDKPNDKGNSVMLELDLYVYEEPDNDVRIETANYIKDTLEAYGFSINIITVSYAQAAQKLSAGAFELALASYAMDSCPDAGFMLISGNTGNYCRYRSTAMTDLCSELRTQLDQSNYQYTLYKIQEQFAKDCPFICMFYRSSTVLTRKMYTTVRDVRELELLRGIEYFRE